MPKTAAELVPLKRQLSQSLALFRFADSTTDFRSPTTGQWTEDDWNTSGYDPENGLLNTGGAGTLPPQVAVPPNFAATLNVGGGNLGRVGTPYLIIAYDASARAGQATAFWIRVPPSIPSGASITISWPAVTGATTIRVWGRESWGVTNTGGWSYRELAGTATSTVITSEGGTLGVNNTTTPPPGTSSVSTAPAVGPITVTYNTTGGTYAPAVLGYRVSAFTAMGETTPSSILHVQPEGKPIVGNGTGQVAGLTATPSNASGTLAGGTYYYAVTARTEMMRNTYSTQNPYHGESLAPTPVEVVTNGATPYTRVDLAWDNASAPEHVDYRIYRGTSATDLKYLATVSANISTYVDDGTATPSADMRPPTTYNGKYIGSDSVSLTWSAVTGCAGYYVYRGGFTSDQSTHNHAYRVDGSATTSFVDTAAAGAGAGRYSSSANLSGVGGIYTAGQYVNWSDARVITEIGYTFKAVQGQRYRLALMNISGNIMHWQSGWLTPSGSGINYFSAKPNFQITAGNWYFVMLQAEGAGGPLDWPVMPVLSQDVPGAPENRSTMLIWPTAASQTNSVTGFGGVYSGQYLTHVADMAAVSLPIRIVSRTYRPSSSHVTPLNGGLIGSDRNAPLQVLTNNQTYTKAIKSLIPTWDVIAPRSPRDQLLMGAKYVKIEVSQDLGATFQEVFLGKRHYFPTPASQIMFRVTFPSLAPREDFDPRIGNMPHFDYTNYSSTYLAGTTGFTGSQGHALAYYNHYGASNAYWVSSGAADKGAGTYYVSSFNYNNLSSDIMCFQNISYDADVTCRVYPEYSTAGEGGPAVRYDQGDLAGGYLFGLNNNGNAYFRSITSGTASVIIATITGVVRPNQWNNARLICKGDRFIGFVNGRLVMDITDTTWPASGNNNSHGIRGHRARFTHMQCAPLNPTTYTKSWELDYLTAYLET